MKIQLKNHVVLEATQEENGTFMATLKSGVVKYYTDSQIVCFYDDDGNIVLNPEGYSKKEDIKMVHHYLQTVKVGELSVIMRFITSIVPDNVAERYTASVDDKRPHNGILAISTGSWSFGLLEWNLIRSGQDFTMMVMSNEDVAKYSPDKLQGMIDRSSFAYANASYSFFIKTEDEEWGLSYLNLGIDFYKKSAKRLQEVARIAEGHLHWINSDRDVNWAFGEFLEDPQAYHDGVTYMARDFAAEVYRNCTDLAVGARRAHAIMTGKMRRGTLRFKTPGGTIKGDVIFVPRKQIGGKDFVTDWSNLKIELKTIDDSYHMVLWEHEPLHLATFNGQSTGTAPEVFTEEFEIACIDRLITQQRELLESGILPKYLYYGETGHSDSGVPELEDRLSDSVVKQWHIWDFHGLPHEAAQNIIYMALNGTVERMTKSDMRYSPFTRSKFFKKMWVPMTNAIVASVVTYESATKMGGFEFPGRNPNTVFYDHRLGLVIPGKRFLETFDAHGTWDQDDVVTVVAVKLWASADVSIHSGITIPSDMVLPEREEDAIEVFFLIRTPNGPGEFSFEWADFRGFSNALLEMGMYDPAHVVTVDLAKMARPQQVMMEEVEVLGLPTGSTNYTNESMTKEDSVEMIKAQMLNPNVGRFANAMMAWANVAPGSFPPVMLDTMGQIIDACQQGFDVAQFEAITAEPDSIYNQIVNYLETHPEAMVDAATAAIRMPTFWQKKVAERIVVGRATRVQRHYAKAIDTIRTEIQNHSLQKRAQCELVKVLTARPLTTEASKWSLDFYNEFARRFYEVDNEFKVDQKMDPFTKMAMQYGHKDAMERLVTEMVAHFESIEDDDARYMRIINLYKWIVQPAYKMPLGHLDRIIFQAGARRDKSLMHILIEAFYHFNTKKVLTVWTKLLSR